MGYDELSQCNSHLLDLCKVLLPKVRTPMLRHSLDLLEHPRAIAVPHINHMDGLNMVSKINIKNNLDMEVIINGAERVKKFGKSACSKIRVGCQARLVQAMLSLQDSMRATLLQSRSLGIEETLSCAPEGMKQKMLYACRYQVTLVRKDACQFTSDAESSNTSEEIIVINLRIHEIMVRSEMPAWHELIGWSSTLHS